MADDNSESFGTASSSLIDSFNISFENIRHSARQRFLFGGQKTILKGISGTFMAGELTAIMGQSGAGKSTLMDILAGYTQPTEGQNFVNGQVRDDVIFRRYSCYILQDDNVQDILSIQESLDYAAELKLGCHIGKATKNKRVNEIIYSLGLEKVRHTKAKDLSGGQRKRLAIGLELVSDPSILFIDEPLSGLDSSMSKQMLYLLRLLARQGRTVVMTLHQPSATMLRMVDRVYAVLDGRCIYNGSVPSLLPYLEQMDLKCPTYHNPVDYLMEICEDNVDELVMYSENGRCDIWTNSITDNDDFIDKHSFHLYEEVNLSVLPAPKSTSTNLVLQSLQSTYAVSYFKQFSCLTRRAWLVTWRNPESLLMMVSVHLALALLVGVLYYDIGKDAHHFRYNYNFLFYSLLSVMYIAFSSTSIRFPRQLSVVRREHFNRWYSVGPYYASTLAAALPVQNACSLAFALIAYWLTGQPLELIRFCAFSWTLTMVVNVSLCLGLLNGSVFDVKAGSICGPLLIMPFILFAGFFLEYKDAAYVFRWLFHVSFLRHGLMGLVLCIFGWKRPKTICTADFCEFKDPKLFIKYIGMEDAEYSLVVMVLVTINVIIIICGYILLWIRLRRKW